MTILSLNNTYVLIDPAGTILKADTDMEKLLAESWDHGMGYTVVPLSRLEVSIRLNPVNLSRIYEFLRGIVAEDNAHFTTRYTRSNAKSLPEFERFYRDQVKEQLLAGQKIVAIKNVRDYSNLGLGNAKAYVDWLVGLPTLP